MEEKVIEQELNFGHKTTMLGAFKDMIAELETRGGEEAKEKVETLKKLYRAIEGASNEAELKQAIGEFVEKTSEFEIMTENIGFKIIKGPGRRKVKKSEFIDSVALLSETYAENFMEHIVSFDDVKCGLAVGGNLAGEEVQRTLMIQDGENILSLETLLEVFTTQFRDKVMETMVRASNSKMDRLREQSNNLKI
ncbi:MAG: hypothetical protein RSD13_02870 [Clostridium sp.]